MLMCKMSMDVKKEKHSFYVCNLMYIHFHHCNLFTGVRVMSQYSKTLRNNIFVLLSVIEWLIALTPIMFTATCDDFKSICTIYT